ncbi:dienelactone hydrolase family protein [Kordiimonas lipolytica]|uniref:Dienelactone hydrolase family protein n=1 Tax=Kordiimonas lipolytica TaxID=1662421 RepID=A0ABV8U6M5_9PROT|nr:alpha/beta hydrolase-fold protein [Kordiimonas lipolytica]
MPTLHDQLQDQIHDLRIDIPLATVALEGRLTIPGEARQIAIFAHGSGSSRFSPRNWYVAEIFHQQHIATLLTDLLTEKEGREDQMTFKLRFDITLLADRLVQIGHWVKTNDRTKHLERAFFGSSTGAAAALIAAAESPDNVTSIVSRGGRPDLAGEYLPHVKAPTLLIVGGDDRQVLDLNEQALARLNDRSDIHVVPGAGHLFEEHGALDKVAHLAADWIKHHSGTRHEIS